MATTIQSIDVGTRGNDGSGDNIREAFKKVNSNFSLLSSIVLGEGESTLKFANLADFGNNSSNPYHSNQLLMSTNAGTSISCRTITAGAGITIDKSSDTEIIITASSLANLYTGQITESDGKFFFSNELARGAFSPGFGITMSSGVVSVDNSTVATVSSLDAEITRAMTAEAAISGSISNTSGNVAVETSRAIAAEATLQSNITNEASRALAAEDILQNTINNETSARISDITNEQARASTAESILESYINNEISARITADTDETSRAVAAESTLQANITNEASSRAVAITTETSRAVAAESTLQTHITAAETTLTAITSVYTNTSSSDVSFTTSNLPAIISDTVTHGSARSYTFSLIPGRVVHIINRSTDTINLHNSSDLITPFHTLSGPSPQVAIIACDTIGWTII